LQPSLNGVRIVREGSFLSGRKLVGFYFLMAMGVAAFAALCLEAAAYHVMVVQGHNVYLPLEIRKAMSKEVREKTERLFSYELGWEPGYPASRLGYRGPEKDVANAVIAVFGDSFTEGHRDLEKSWPFLLERKLGRPVLNFGVSGYGTDQAFWRFQTHFQGKIRAPFAALCIMSENIARVVNRYRGFYRRGKDISLTKPMYIQTGPGRTLLLKNPLESPEDIGRLADMDFLREIGRTDYWFGHFERHGLNRFVHFPYGYFFLKALPYYVRSYRDKMIRNEGDYKALYRDERALSVMEHIIRRFVRSARDQGVQPIVLFLPCWKDFADHEDRGRTVYGALAEAVRREHGATFDAMAYFAPRLEIGEKTSSFFASRSDGHYNARGEEVLGDGFHASLKGLLEGAGGARFPGRDAAEQPARRGDREVRAPEGR